jgi:hypothetical protein
VGDKQKLGPKAVRQFLIGRIVWRKFKGDLEHVLAEQRHPGGAVGLLQKAPGG